MKKTILLVTISILAISLYGCRYSETTTKHIAKESTKDTGEKSPDVQGDEDTMKHESESSSASADSTEVTTATLVPAKEATEAPSQKPTQYETTAPTAKPQTAATVPATPAPTAPITDSNGLVIGLKDLSAANASRYAAQISALIQVINIERGNAGLSQLTMNANLNLVSGYRSSECAANLIFSHTRPDGSRFSNVTLAYGIPYSTIGENLAKDYTTAQEVITAWMNSPIHCKNILNPAWTTMGVGLATDRNGSVYWTATFLAPQ